MNKKLRYHQTGFNINNNLAWCKYLHDENGDPTYLENNYFDEIILYI